MLNKIILASKSKVRKEILDKNNIESTEVFCLVSYTAMVCRAVARIAVRSLLSLASSSAGVPEVQQHFPRVSRLQLAKGSRSHTDRSGGLQK